MENVANGKDWKLSSNLDYTGREKSQQNHLVEVGYHTIGGRARLMLHKEKLPEKYDTGSARTL